MFHQTFPNLVFKAQPDRYGRFGHQTFSLLAAWCFANRFNARFIPTQYAYFAIQYNSYVNFCDSKAAYKYNPQDPILDFCTLQGSVPDPNGNNKYNLQHPIETGFFLEELASLSSKNHTVLVELPFDQTPGKFILNIPKYIHSDLVNIFSPLININKTINHDPPLVVLHIRRGDVDTVNHPNWFISDERYIYIIKAVSDYMNENVRIVVLLQGSNTLAESAFIKTLINKGILRIRFTEGRWTNENEIQDFATMLNADMLIAGQSSYSLLAALIKYGRIPICIVKNRLSRIPHNVSIDNLVYCEDTLLSPVSIETAIDSSFTKYLSKAN